MLTEHHPDHDIHCITLRAVPHFAPETTLQPLSIDAELSMTITPNQTLISVPAVIHQLQTISRQLTDISQHPSDQRMVAIEAQQLADITLLLVRTTPRQTRIDSSTVEEQANTEMAETQRLIRRMQPLVQGIAEGTQSAEELMELIHTDPSPARAKRVLHSLATGTAAIMSDHESLTAPKDSLPSSSLTVEGRRVHELLIDIIVVNRDTRVIEVRLRKTLAPSTLFEGEQFGRQSIRLKVPGAEDFFLLAQAASVGLKVALQAQINVVLTAKGVSYQGTVLQVCDPAGVVTALQQAFRIHQQELFESDAR